MSWWCLDKMVQHRFAFKKGFIIYYAIQLRMFEAALAQLGERQTEDLKAPCSIHGGGIFFPAMFEPSKSYWHFAKR